MDTEEMVARSNSIYKELPKYLQSVVDVESDFADEEVIYPVDTEDE